MKIIFDLVQEHRSDTAGEIPGYWLEKISMVAPGASSCCTQGGCCCCSCAMVSVNPLIS